MVRVLVAAFVVLTPVVVRADLISDGAKFVPMSARYDGRLPAGKVVVVGGVWDGALALKRGEVSSRLAWHPFDGRMQLRLVDASVMEDAPGRQAPGFSRFKAALRDAVACGEPFVGFREIPATSPVVEIRFVFAVQADEADECVATMRTEYLNKQGEAVEPGDLSTDNLTPSEPLKLASEEQELRDMLAVADEKRVASGEIREMPTPREMREQAQPAAITAHGCGCRASGEATWMFGIVALVRRRRR